MHFGKSGHFRKSGIGIPQNIYKEDLHRLEEDEELFTFSGHIHPGVKIRGAGRQSLSLPCFYFGKEFAVLPAFSVFTGLAKINPKKGDHVFALIENTVVKLS